MTYVQREHPDARAELRAGAGWYDDPAVGQELLDATLQARRSIASMPDAWPAIRTWHRSPTLRAKSVRGSPYQVIYVVANHEIVIVAYAHEKRLPGYWRRRIGS